MKKTVPYITNLKNSRVVSMMTAYDYPSAKAVSEAEIDIILVGDSLAQVVLGHDDTCLLYTSPSPRDVEESRMPSSA